MSEKFDLIVIGAGPGGYVAAIKAAQLGMKTAVVESREVGGTCLNRGCIPTKALIHAAELYSEMKSLEEIGLYAEGISYDIKKIHQRKDEVLNQIRSGILSLFKSNKITLINGKGTILSEGRVEVKTAEERVEYEAAKILIAAGSVPSRPPIPGLDLENVITSDELLSMNDRIYNNLVIIGGGVIGVEFASVYSALGARVTIIEALDRILPNMDKEISQNLKMILKKRGVDIHTSAKVEKITMEDGLKCYYEEKEKVQCVPCDGVLVAIGRKPNTAGLFAEGVSVQMDRGSILVDEKFETSMKNVYAIGDAIKGIQLAHVASAQGINAVMGMAGKKGEINLDLVPSCIYTSPEIASVGIDADEAKRRGISAKCGKFIMSANGKSVISREERGFVKVVAEEGSNQIIGAQMMCARATDMISEFTTAIANGLTLEQMLSAMRPHPTYNEGVTEALEAVEGNSIHTAPRR